MKRLPSTLSRLSGGLGESVKGQLLKSIGWHGVNFPGAGFAIVAIWRIGGMSREDSAAGIKKWGEMALSSSAPLSWSGLYYAERGRKEFCGALFNKTEY